MLFRLPSTLRTMPMPGSPRGTPSRCGRSGHEVGRRRPIGAVAVLQSASARPRRWGDAGTPRRECVTADQKAGAPGRRRGDQRQQPGTSIGDSDSDSDSDSEQHPAPEHASTKSDYPSGHPSPTLKCDVFVFVAMDSLRVLCVSTLRWCDGCDEIRVHPRNPRPICDGCGAGTP
mgnify:CR=1 FL=1